MSLVDESYVREILSRLSEIPLLDKSTLYNYTIFHETDDSSNGQPSTRFFSSFLSSQDFTDMNEIAQWMNNDRVRIQCTGGAADAGTGGEDVIAMELYPVSPASGRTVSQLRVVCVVMQNGDTQGSIYEVVTNVSEWDFTRSEPVEMLQQSGDF